MEVESTLALTCGWFRAGVMQTETLRSQLDRTMEEFKAKESERDAQKKQLTAVVEDLLRKVRAA